MKGRAIPYSAEELAWLEEHHRLVLGDYVARFNARFTRDVSAQNLKALRHRKGWLTGRTGQFVRGQVAHNKGQKCAPGEGGNHPNTRRTQFRKGALPHNTKYIGHERVSKDGYVEISIAQINPHTGFSRRYVLKHRWEWEKRNGPVAQGMVLKCLDGDKTNTAPENWELIPRAALPFLNGHRGFDYDQLSPELRPYALAIAKLRAKAREKLQPELKEAAE